MEIYKIIAIALITVILCVYLKNINSDFLLPTILCGSIILLTLSIDYIIDVFSLFNNLADRAGINKNIFGLVIKITIVAYLIEFACNLVDDFAIKSLTDKISFAGKLLLISMSAPIFLSLFEVIIGLLE